MSSKSKVRFAREPDCANSRSPSKTRQPAKCPLCSKTLRDIHGMRRHIKTHTKEKPYNCKLCDYSCASAHSIPMHMERIHDNPAVLKKYGRFKCTHCDFATNFKGNYNQHQLLKHLGEVVQCEHSGCNFSSRQKAVLKRHQLSHTKTLNFACDYPGCDYSSQYKYTLARHKNLVHVKKDKFPCPIPGCSYSATIKSKLPSHVHRIHNGDGQKKIQCPEEGCHFKSKHKEGLQDHLYEHRKNRVLQCPIEGCKVHAKTKIALMYHKRLHEPTKEFTCTLCHFKYETYDALSSHIRNHTKEQLVSKFKCGECGELCIDLQNVSSHVGRKHPEMLEGCRLSIQKEQVLVTQSESLYCNIVGCQFRTFSPQDLETHCDKSHSDRRFLCRHQECHFRGRSEKELKAHQVNHDETQRPYKCPMCPFRPGRKSYMVEHMERRHLSIKWACKFCQNNIFHSKVQLQKHLVKSHVAQAI